MKMTLLEMTQDILSDLNSDQVNSISDTPESAQVIAAIRSCYYELVSARDDWPWLHQLTSLTGLGDTDTPTTMLMPEGLNKIEWLRYNRKPVTYITPEKFREKIDARLQGDVLASNVTADGYLNDRDPTYWTTFDEQYVVMDSYDSAEESTLQESNSAVYGVVAPSWTVDDTFVPTLPDKMFPTLLAAAKSKCFLIHKQSPNPIEERNAHKGLVRWQSKSTRVRTAEPTTNTKVDYGRR